MGANQARDQVLESLRMNIENRHDLAPERLAEMEAARIQLVRAYREMNDRFFRLRQQQTGALPGASITAKSKKRKQRKSSSATA